MAQSKPKYYVVWEGREPGVYDNWDDAFEQIDGFPGAKFKSYATAEAAVAAYRGPVEQQAAFLRKIGQYGRSRQAVDYSTIPGIRLDAIATDGACAHNPGPMEYRCVRVADGVEIFHGGPYAEGTNNIGEYLALIHAAALLDKRGNTTTPIYTDSRTALSWIKRGRSNTKLTPTEANAPLRELLARADAWLATHTIANPILKWDTDNWGEIPADFGRKK